MNSGTILDVGCFDGEFLNRIDNGWDRYGIEINHAAALQATAAGITILGNDWKDIDKIDKSFDVVTAIDIVEHTRNPLGFLASLASVLNPSGYLILSTGNTNALSWRLMGGCYWYCTIPEHLSFIDRNWCRYAARELGLRMEKAQLFSHNAQAGLRRQALELMGNFVYRVSPDLYVALRRRQKSSTSARYDSQFEEVRVSPPRWSTARDHILLILRKPGKMRRA